MNSHEACVGFFQHGAPTRSFRAVAARAPRSCGWHRLSFSAGMLDDSFASGKPAVPTGHKPSRVRSPNTLLRAPVRHANGTSFRTISGDCPEAWPRLLFG